MELPRPDRLSWASSFPDNILRAPSSLNIAPRSTLSAFSSISMAAVPCRVCNVNHPPAFPPPTVIFIGLTVRLPFSSFRSTVTSFIASWGSSTSRPLIFRSTSATFRFCRSNGLAEKTLSLFSAVFSALLPAVFCGASVFKTGRRSSFCDDRSAITRGRWPVTSSSRDPLTSFSPSLMVKAGIL